MNHLHKLILLVVVLFAVVSTANTQNLIVDPGFEIWNGSVSVDPGLSSLTHWYSVGGTPDHHHQLNPPGSNLTSLENCPTGQGNTECGVPLNGQAVVGIYKANGPDGGREWAGIELSEPMVAGGCYEISFWIQNKKDEPGNEYVSNQWGVFFDHTEFPFFNPNFANYAAMSDHWVACEEVIDGSEWIKVEFDYQASEAFEYAYVGFMGDFSTSTFSVANTDNMLGYYVWIDEVIVNHINPQLTLTEDVSICLGENVTLEATSNFPIKWEDNNSSLSSRSVNPDSTTTYYVQTLDSTLCSIRDSIVVTVLGNQVIDFAGVNICDGADPLILDASLPNGMWTGPGIIDNTQGLFDPALTGIGEFSINYISDADCSENFTLDIVVNPSPIIDFEADLLQGCPPLEIQFNDSSPTAGIAYEWDFGNGVISNDPFITSTVYTELGSYDVNLEVVFSENCKSTLNIPAFIEVFAPPEASFTYAPFVLSNLNSFVEFNNTSTGNIAEVSWDFDDGTTSNSYNPQTTFHLPGIYAVRLGVTSSNGCVDSITQEITVNSQVNIYVPNAFSPNQDGVNDFFEVFTAGPIREYEIIIFDRWGGVKYQSNNIDDSWDGSFLNGEECSEGVYLYSIQYTYQGLNDGLFISGQKTGDFMILRE